jgi:hypothetical protein
MSRVLMVTLDEGEVVASCLAAKVGISVIEGLPGGGTRLVCASIDGADRMRRKLKRQLISGSVVRSLYRPGMPPL